MPTVSVRRHVCRITLLYLSAVAAWVVLGDLWVFDYTDGDPGALRLSLFKGLAFAACSSALLYLLLTRLMGRLDAEHGERARRETFLRQAVAVFDSTHEGVLITDGEGRVTRVNGAFTRITEYTEADMLGRNPGLLKSGHHDQAFYDAMWRSLAERDEWSGEIWNRRKGGDVYPQWQTIRVLRSHDGKPESFVAVFSDVSAIKRSQRELANLVHYDPLTHLPNRLLFIERLGHAFRRLSEQGGLGGLLLINLDSFRQINESFGHGVGDSVLKEIARRLQTLLAPGVSVCHLGADEFVLMCEGLSDSVQMARLAGRALETVQHPIRVDQQELTITASAGISLFPDNLQSVDQVLRNATSACAEAKREGRETYAFYTQELTVQARRRVELGIALRQAIERDELCVHFQPIHDLASGRMIGVESLVRWLHPARGLIMPGEFIPLAEDLGLIGAIDGWVLRAACRQMRRWREEGVTLSFVAVNVSSTLFRQHDIAQRVQSAIRDADIDPDTLELEVTESAVMVEPDAALAQLERLRGMGVRLAIDDFGTGYSSLSRLKLLPIEKIKIDKGFIAGLPHDSGDKAIVLAVIALAHELGLRVLAEGVETEAQRDFLLQHGCTFGQGYFFGRPVPADALFQHA